jgi:CheY-like chemotaxis protein
MVRKHKEELRAEENPVPDHLPVVMVVEDEWLLREQIAEDLRDHGWDVLEASTGEKALGYVRSGRHLDLLITDIRLPGRLNGWDIAELCRDVEPELPVIYTTANAQDASRMVSGSLFLGKPIRVDVLVDTCRSLVGV